eukprot:COSAG02_NODE_10360_length_1960_cov_1.484686_2_plen_146_part_00
MWMHITCAARLTSTLCVAAETSPQVIQSANMKCQSLEDAAVAHSQIASPIRPWKRIGSRPNLSDNAPMRGETRAIVKLPVVQSTVLQKFSVAISCLHRSSSLPVRAVPVSPNCMAHCGKHNRKIDGIDHAVHSNQLGVWCRDCKR